MNLQNRKFNNTLNTIDNKMPEMNYEIEVKPKLLHQQLEVEITIADQTKTEIIKLESLNLEVIDFEMITNLLLDTINELKCQLQE